METVSLHNRVKKPWKTVSLHNRVKAVYLSRPPLNSTTQDACALGCLYACIHLRPDWESVKIDVMYKALKCKFSIYPHLNSMLLSTAGSVLVEASPHDLFWGGGREGEGLNYLGRLLMQLRSEFLGESSVASESNCLAL